MDIPQLRSLLTATASGMAARAFLSEGNSIGSQSVLGQTIKGVEARLGMRRVSSLRSLKAMLATSR